MKANTMSDEELLAFICNLRLRLFAIVVISKERWQAQLNEWASGQSTNS